MPAFLGIALQLLGGWLKKLFSALLSIQLPAIVPAALLAVLAFQHVEMRHTNKLLAHCKQDSAIKQKSIDNLIKGQAEANAHARAEKAKTEAKYLQIQKDSTNAYKAELAAARGRLAEWMRSHRADQGRAERADLPRPTESATGPDGADTPAFLVGSADLSRCTQAYVTATAWQSWWTQIKASEHPTGE